MINRKQLQTSYPKKLLSIFPGDATESIIFTNWKFLPKFAVYRILRYGSMSVVKFTVSLDWHKMQSLNYVHDCIHPSVTGT